MFRFPVHTATKATRAFHTSSPSLCAIWGYMAKQDVYPISQLFNSSMKVQPRGPDRSEFKVINDFCADARYGGSNSLTHRFASPATNMYIGFHRLAIMDNSTDGDQPFTLEINKRSDVLHPHGRSVYATCNGELYNYVQLAEKYNIKLSSRSDCEILTHLYKLLGFEKMMKELRGEFAISIMDMDKDTKHTKLFIGRDPLGVRPVFIGQDDVGLGYSSELKGLIDIVDPSKISQLQGGTYLEVNTNESGDFSTTTRSYYNVADIKQQPDKPLDEVLFQVRQSFIEAVECRMASDRPMGALLSGGLDSSLVVSIAASYLKRHGKRLRTFSIGIPGATDREYAELVSRHCDTDHTHIELTTDQFLAAIPKVVEMTETHDITTVRASTGQYLCSEWIAKNTDIKVLLIGDGSDECCAGYMYFHNAPSPQESHQENLRLLQDIIYYDVLRADRAIAGHGLEARVPFLDHEFISTFLAIDPDLRVPTVEVEGQRRIEKWLLRKAFDGSVDSSNPEGTQWLPSEVLWRMKEAFSDGVSSKEKSWYEIIQDEVEDLYTEEDFKHPDVSRHIQPHSKEALHYRKLFNAHFNPDAARVIPYYWLPRWSGNVTDPSARTLDIYSQASDQ